MTVISKKMSWCSYYLFTVRDIWYCNQCCKALYKSWRKCKYYDE